jgi:hypothetical protein
MARKHHIPVGVDAVNAKLTDEDVIDIRTCYVPRHQYLGGQALWRVTPDDSQGGDGPDLDACHAACGDLRDTGSG